ncbi:non-ribosomal peptide synthetase, partial [Chryseobacterium potabilaquae]|uniref:non-ribosomal peptide synthetase n=1 Tax=Chryseobacterium potabilaquae TaxID=2675057 RepID=UPI00138A3793
REEELRYWNSIIENTKNSSLHIQSLSSSLYHHSDLVLDKDSTGRLLRDIHGVYHTQINDVLLSAFSLALCDFTGLSTHGILLEGHGREDIFPGMDITETVGWFTTMYPIVLERGKDLFSTLVHTKESLRGIPDNGIGYGSLIGYTDGNLPRVSFNYLGQLDQQESVSESWYIVGENSGEPVGRDNLDSHLLTINGAVVGGELYFGLRGYFSEEEMIRLSVLFKGYLEQLVNGLSGIDRSYLTLSDVDHIISSSQLASIQEEIEIDSVYLASSLQEGFIYHALSQGDVDDSYRVQLLWDYHGGVDLDKLKESWEYVQKKHPVLRTRFDWSESIVQVIDKIGSVDWRCIDLSEYDEKEREDKIKSIVQKDREEQYDLSKSGLFRVYVCQHSESHYTCIFSNHHAILDGWSMPVLFNDIHTTYLRLLKGEVVASMVDISYGESQKYLQSHKGESDSFWKEYMLLLEDREDLSSLLTVSEKHTNLSSYRHIQDHQSLTLHIKEERYTLLKNLISKEGLTVNAVLQYVWHKQLSIYSHQRTTVVGTTVSGRSLPVEGIESSVGLYINTLPLIVEHKEGKVMDVIINLQSSVSDLNTYSDKSLSSLQDNGERLFSSLFVYENYPISDGDVSEDLDIRFRDSIEKVDYPLSLIAYERGEEVSLTLNYEGLLFERSMMSQVLEGMELMLDQLLEDPTITTDRLSYVSALQYQDLIHNWNATRVEYDTSATLHELFERQVEKTPDHIALVYEDVKLTYRELNGRSNRLAHYLLETYKIQSDELIPLCLERSEQMLIGILGVLKSGGAYVPMDPNYPMDRIEHILGDTKARMVIVEENTKGRLYDYKKLIETEEEALDIISLNNSEMKTKLSKCSNDNPNTEVSSGDLSYVIYTSGTTGKPKGVMIEHKNVVNLIEQQSAIFNLDTVHSSSHPQKRALWYANYVFDAHVWDVYSVLSFGHTLHLISKEIQTDLSLLHRYIVENRIQIATIPPILLTTELILPLDTLIVAGDTTHPEVMEYYKREGVDVINAYGPTESTVCATYHHYNEDGNALNIGQSIANTTAYVLDEYLRPVPVGAIGELYIGGLGLSRGYLNLAELTAERFLLNPFQSEKEKEIGYNGRMYKTGDLGRYLPGGDLEYIGRNDFQVKIRGYRIELGEIENALLSYEGIRQSVVLAKENSSGLKYLVGYYVSDAALNHEELSVHLSGLLPEYMVPSVYVHLEELPLTINGKLDRRALPEPNFTGDKEYIAPTTVLEKQLAEMYGEVLGLPVESIGLHDDFFRLGGDSIISIQLVSRLRKRLSLSLSVKEVFTYRTVYHLSELLESRKDEEGLSLITEQGILEGEVSLLPIQEWFFHEVELGEHFTSFHHWNQSFMIHVPELDIDILKQSLLQLVEKHDALRLYYPKTEHGYLQEYRKEAISPDLSILDRRDVSDEELIEVFTSWQSGFDIIEGPLLHVGYIHGYEDGSCRVHFCFHHLIIDAVSWRILTEDLELMYRSLKEGNTNPLYVKGSSYRQWVDVVKTYKEDSATSREEELRYWNSIIENTKNSSIYIQSLSSSLYHHSDLVLDKDSTSRLLRDIHGVYHTQINDVLLSAFSLALCDFTGLSTHGIVLEGHGREDIFPGMDITETVGWFTTMYPIVLERGRDLFSTLVHTKESLRGIPDNGIGYGSLIGYTDGNLPRVSFNYLGQLDQQESVSESWHIVGENSGEPVGRDNLDSHLLTINGAVVGGELYFGLRGYFSEEEMIRLSVLFKGYLEQLVNGLSGIDRSYLTLSDVDHILSSSQLDSIQEEIEIDSVYLASSLQEGFIYHALSQGDVDDSYRVQLLWDYHGVVDLDKLKESWEYVQNKHPVLRTRFDWSESIVQVIDKISSVDWRCIDLSGYDEKEREDKIKSIVQKDREEQYDLSKSGLFRVYVCQHSESHYTCIFSNHHAILDGWSMPVLFNDIHTTYLRLLKGELVASMVDISYGESQKYLQSHKGESDSFWKEYMLLLEDREDLSSLLTVSERHTNLSGYRHIQDHQSLTWSIDRERYLSLKNLISKEGLTVNAVLQYVWHKQLSIYSNQRTTVVGTTVSGRSLPVEGIESSVGLYINTLPLIVEHKEGKVLDWIAKLQDGVSDLNTYSDKSLSSLQQSGERLFSSLFVYENYPISDGVVLNGLDIKPRESIEKVDYPLSLIAYERGEEISMTLTYEGLLFERAMMSQVLEGMELMLDQLLQDPAITTDRLSYVSVLQYQDLIHSWNATGVEYDTSVTLHELFERQVEKTPDHIALVYEDVKLSYRELNERSNQLAHYLLETYKIQPDELIPLCLERSEQMLIGILGVLKSGGAYVP